jgi:hypothetical protein
MSRPEASHETDLLAIEIAEDRLQSSDPGFPIENIKYFWFQWAAFLRLLMQEIFPTVHVFLQIPPAQGG